MTSISLPYETQWTGIELDSLQPRDERQVLDHLRLTAESWLEPIQQGVYMVLENEQLIGGVLELLGGVSVGGKNLKDLATKFDNYIGMMREVASIVDTVMENDQLKVVLEDTVNILALVGVMCSESLPLFQKNNAEATWKELLKHAEQIHRTATASYKKHERVYKQIYEIVCNHLPTDLKFMINVAASIAAFAWSHRVAIAKWIAENWKTAGYFALVVGAVAAIGGAALYLANRLRKKERNRQQ